MMQAFAHNKTVMKRYTRYVDSIVTGSVRGFEHIDADARDQRAALLKREHETQIVDDGSEDTQNQCRHHEVPFSAVVR